MPLDELAIDASRMVTHARTGTENYSVEIIRAIAAVENRPSLTLVARSSHPIEAVPDTRMITSGPARLWTHLGLSRAIRAIRPDALFVPSHVIPVVHPKATVVTVHDLGYLREAHAHPRAQRVMLDRTTRWNVRAARKIIAISEQTRRDLIDVYNVPAEKVTVIHHGVDHQRFHPMPEIEISPTLEKLKISQPYLLFVSTVQPRKNVDRLVEAFEHVAKPNLTLVIAGKSGWLGEPVEENIRQSRLAAQIRRIGYVADDDLPALYSGAEAFVLPSLFEGFGMGIIEAMASGTPVVTSNSGSTAEVAGEAAILVDPASVDSIAAGIEQSLVPQTAFDLRSAGLKRARDFSWATAAAQTLDVIRDAYDDL